MRFQIETNQTSNGAVSRIRDVSRGNSAAILMDHGARLNDLTISVSSSPVHIIEGLRDDEHPANDRWFKNALLIPFPSRLPEGRFRWNGTEYQLPCNVPGQSISLHGFIYNQPFTIARQTVTDDYATLESIHAYRGDRPGFPFPFDVRIADSLNASGSFTRSTTITNRHDTPIPMFAGWHPYFTMGASVDDLLLHIPSASRIELDDRLLPSGRLPECSWFNPSHRIGNRDLNDGFRLAPDHSPFRVMLEHPGNGLRILFDIDCGLDQYRIVHLFTPPSRSSISIEPLTGYGNGLVTGTDRITIQPGRSLSMSCRITLRDNRADHRDAPVD